MTIRGLRLALLTIVLLANVSAAAEFTPTADYEPRELCGFALRVHPAAIQHADDLAVCLEELESQLRNIQRVVPDRALAELQKVPFWIEWQVKPRGAAEVHVSAGWLKENGYNPDKLYGVEINNCRNFVDWSRSTQPWMVLHELAHAYHHRVLGADHRGLRTAFAEASEQQLYEVALHVNGRRERAYALTNVDEYFAELTEAYFGKNDFYPFLPAELREHDPVGHLALQAIWGDPVDRR
ncbi:MAG: hypothetical protein SH850_29740 [Planctomycetaceae bacterium]|nr:hypothetical protein [Planctomycetaceae bacterium]